MTKRRKRCETHETITHHLGSDGGRGDGAYSDRGRTQEVGSASGDSQDGGYDDERGGHEGKGGRDIMY